MPHFERWDALERSVKSVFDAACFAELRPNIIVLDDSHQDYRDLIKHKTERAAFEYGRVEYLPYNDGKPQWSHKFNHGYSVAVRDPDLPPPDLIAIVSADFILSTDFFAIACASLFKHPRSLIVAPGLNADDSKSVHHGGLINPRTGDKQLKHHAFADNGMLYLLDARDWLPWDLEADQFGFAHALPEWLFRMHKKIPFWRCDSLDAVHQDDSAAKRAHPEWQEQVTSKEAHAWYQRKTQ